MPEPPQTPPLSQADEDLLSMFVDMGITPEMVLTTMAGQAQSGLSSPYSEFADPEATVFAGTNLVPRYGANPEFYEQEIRGREGARYRPQPTEGEVRGREGTRYRPRVRVEEETGTVGDLLTDFYEWNRNELLDRQRQLYAAGFYGDIDITKVSWGVHDEASFVAWAQAVARASRFFEAGKKASVDDVLRAAARERLGNAGIMGGAGGAGGGGGGGGARTVSLSDPLSLYSVLDSTAQSILGRKATAEEQRMFVGIVHSLQRESQLAVQPESGAGQPLPADPNGDGRISQAELEAALASRRSDVSDDTVSVGTPPSPEAQAESLLRTQNPTEAGAYDIASSFANFIQLLRGVV